MCIRRAGEGSGVKMGGEEGGKGGAGDGVRSGGEERDAGKVEGVGAADAGGGGGVVGVSNAWMACAEGGQAELQA